MRGLEKNRMKRDTQTDRHTYNGHRDSMIESAQWADSMKSRINLLPIVLCVTCFHDYFLRKSRFSQTSKSSKILDNLEWHFILGVVYLVFALIWNVLVNTQCSRDGQILDIG